MEFNSSSRLPKIQIFNLNFSPYWNPFCRYAFPLIWTTFEVVQSEKKKRKALVQEAKRKKNIKRIENKMAAVARERAWAERLTELQRLEEEKRKSMAWWLDNIMVEPCLRIVMLLLALCYHWTFNLVSSGSLVPLYLFVR